MSIKDTIPIIRDVAPLESKSPPKTTTSSKNSVPIITEVPKPVESKSQRSIIEPTESTIEHVPSSIEPTNSVIKQAPLSPTEEYVPVIEEKPDAAVTGGDAFSEGQWLGMLATLVFLFLLVWIPFRIHKSARPGTRPQLWIMILLFFFFFPAWLIILIFTRR